MLMVMGAGEFQGMEGAKGIDDGGIILGWRRGHGGLRLILILSAQSMGTKSRGAVGGKGWACFCLSQSCQCLPTQCALRQKAARARASPAGIDLCSPDLARIGLALELCMPCASRTLSCLPSSCVPAILPEADMTMQCHRAFRLFVRQFALLPAVAS